MVEWLRYEPFPSGRDDRRQELLHLAGRRRHRALFRKVRHAELGLPAAGTRLLAGAVQHGQRRRLQPIKNNTAGSTPRLFPKQWTYRGNGVSTSTLNCVVTDRAVNGMPPTVSGNAIDPVLGAVIFGEIGDIRRFESPSKLVAYAGIDATAQSGEFEASHNRMSKRGSPYPRRVLFVACNVTVRSDPDLGAFYQGNLAEGKHHSTCLGAVFRELCYIIHAILTDNRPYVRH